MDLDRGLETKIMVPYSGRGLLQIDLFSLTRENSNKFRYFQLTLWNNRFEFQSCPPGNLSIGDIEGKSFILKIYRKKTELMIDLDGENQIKFDTSTAFSTPDCNKFWGAEDINLFRYDPVSKDVATYYRIPGSEESDDSEDSEDNSDEESDGSDGSEDNTNKLKPGKWHLHVRYRAVQVVIAHRRVKSA